MRSLNATHCTQLRIDLLTTFYINRQIPIGEPLPVGGPLLLFYLKVSKSMIAESQCITLYPAENGIANFLHQTADTFK